MDPLGQNRRMCARHEPRYTLGEEIANSVTHGIGIVLAIAGLAVMCVFAALYGNAWHVVGCTIFGVTLVAVYTISTLYHSIPFQKPKRVLRTLDHSMIYLLIAGTYTPFTLVNLRGPWGWSLFGAVWGLAVAGIVLQSTPLKRFAAISITLYLVMGWLIVVAAKPLAATVAQGGIILMVVGGVVYTSGLAFYGWRRLRYHHAVWHVFVLAGSIVHFFAVLFYVIPSRAA